MDTAPSPLLFGPPVQYAYLVDDAESAARTWETQLGAGPFEILDHIVVDDVRVRGEPATFDHSSAFGWWGTTMIELICIHDAPAELTPRTGLHHVACFVDDVDRALDRATAAGMATAMTARAGQTIFAFVDDIAQRGHFWELYVPTERLLSFYDEVQRRHRDEHGLAGYPG
jgi:catechol 2,3-dioxygenase-like lactoylglutathione lyase family enzyme